MHVELPRLPGHGTAIEDMLETDWSDWSGAAESAYEKLTAEGIRARVVSMPSTDIFDMQDQAYKDSVLPPSVRARVSVEAGSVFGWERYVGLDGAIIGMTSFGASAPAKDLFKKFGFSVDHVIEAAKQVLAKNKK